VADLLAAVREVLDTDPHTLPDAGLLQGAEDLLTARRLLDAALLKFLQAADARDLTAEYAGRSTRSWLIEDKHLAARDAARVTRLARLLPSHPGVADALESGEVGVEHVMPILNTVAKLAPGDQDVDEKILLDAARDLDPDALRQLCRATEEAACCNETVEARRERVYGTRYLTLTETFEGMWRLDAVLPPEDGAMLQSVIAPLARRLDADDDRSAAQRRADALGTVVAAAAGFDDLVPEFNGDRPHLAVTISYQRLVEQLNPRDDYRPEQAPRLGGTPISPATARMLACDAEIIPVVMGGASEVLDIGRASRIWPKAIRKALQLEDNGCGWPECKMPLWACRIHHLTYWFHGGVTSKANGVHLCRFHHWLVHHKPWRIWRDTRGLIQVART
jgi:hypothetical protein